MQERLRFYNSAGLKDKLSIITKLSNEEGQFDAFFKIIPPDSLSFSELTIVDSENEDLKLLFEAAKEFNSAIEKIKSDYTTAVTDLKKLLPYIKVTGKVKKLNTIKKSRIHLNKLKEFKTNPVQKLLAIIVVY